MACGSVPDAEVLAWLTAQGLAEQHCPECRARAWGFVEADARFPVVDAPGLWQVDLVQCLACQAVVLLERPLLAE